MKKSIPFINILIIVVLSFVVLYVAALTIKPVRQVLLHAANGTVLANFLPSEAEHEDIDSAETDPVVLTQIVEIAFNPIAAKNIGLDDSAIITIEPVDYYKSFTFPAVVVECPGFSTITVPAPVSGIIAAIYHETGVAVEPGQPLFDILLTQQDLVKAQSDFLALLQKKKINAAELERLSGLDPQIIPSKRRELEYEKIQIDSELVIQRKILLLQGLSESDIAESLEKKDTIIRNMTVYAPPFVKEENVASAAHADDEEHIYTIDELCVSVGQNVAVGDAICRLTDYCKLAVRGKVFAVNDKELSRALASQSRVTATFEGEGSREIVEGLSLRSIDNRIDAASGTLFCYVDLKNTFTSYEVSHESHLRRYIQWHFKPGQRCELNVEVEPLPNCIVLPIAAVVKSFQEMYVFEWVGNEEEKRIWRKKPVHAVYQTKDHVVIANDGALFPGAKIASKGASFIHAALEAANQKTTGGGGIQHGDHVH